MKASRRQFLKTAAAAGAASMMGPGRLFADGAASAPLQQFGYGDVELLEGPLRQQFQTNHAFYASLDEDRLLKPFRQRAGLPAPGDDMGGWYSWAPLSDLDARPNNGFAPCHSFGQYLSGLSRDYAATADKATQAQVHRFVRNFAAARTQHSGTITLSGLHLRQDLDRRARCAPVRAGSGCAQGSDKALIRSRRICRREVFPGRNSMRGRQGRIILLMSPTRCRKMPSCPCAARATATRIWRCAFSPMTGTDPLANGQNVLSHKHAYSHVNAMGFAMQAYLVLGSEKHLRAAKNGFEFLQTTELCHRRLGAG
jgi:hypothetical protein